MFGLTKEEFAPLFRNFVFGVEDSLVSTVGLLSGVAAAGEEQNTIIVAGIVLIFVEAFSMGVGSLLSDNSAKELAVGAEVPLTRSLPGGLVMLISYFVSGFVPLAPYLFLQGQVAFYTSIGASLFALFLLGGYSAKLSGVPILREAGQMFLIGGMAILLGVLVGNFVQSF